MFQQELGRSGHVEHAQGEWRLFGEGHAAFSEQFLTIHGEPLDSDGTAYGVVKKSFGILPSICLDPSPGGPTYHKKGGSLFAREANPEPMSHVGRCDVAGILDYFFPDNHFGMCMHNVSRCCLTIVSAEEEGMVVTYDLVK
jgi:hypothetical protein